MVERNIVECVKYALVASERVEELTDPAASVASGLSCLVKSASFMESMSSMCFRSGSIAIGVYSFVRSGERSEKSRLFTLFGSTAEKRGSSAVTEENRSNRTNSGAPTATRSDQNELGGRIDEEQEGDDKNGQLEHDLMISNGGVESNITNQRGEVSEGDVAQYAIPEEAMAKCVSFCLDMSGSTSHPSNYGAKDMESVNAKKLSKAVKAIFKMYKNNLSGRGIKTHGLQYIPLLPTAIRRREITVPLIRLSRSEGGLPFTRTGSMTVNLDISKADSNSKDQNIAFVATLLHYRNHGIKIEDVLKQYADIGLGPDGCQKNSLCRAERRKCRCQDAARDVCELYSEVEEQRKVVGKEIVDPYTTYLLGSEVPVSSVVVRVKSVIHSSGMERIPCDVGSIKTMNAHIWSKKDIGRVQLLGDLGDVIGTGILVQERLVNSKRVPRNNLDIRFAAFVCEVEIEEGMKEENYPFSDWYRSVSLRKMGLPSLLECEKAPEKLGDILNVWGKAMLWHKEFIRNGHDASHSIRESGVG